MKVLILILALLVVVGGVLYVNLVQRGGGGQGTAEEAVRAVTTEKAHTGAITAKANAPARVVAKHSVDLFATVAGTIKEIKAKDGDHVDAGAVLFVLVNPKLDSDKELAAVRLESARAEFAESQTALANQQKAKASKQQEAESRKAKADAALAAVQAKGPQYEAEIAGAERTYVRLKSAFDKGGYVEAKDVDEALTALEKAKAQKASWEKDVDQQKASNDADDAAFQQEILRIEREASDADARTKTSQKKVDEAEKNLDVAAKELDKTRVATPMAGTVWNIRVVEGESVTPGSLQSGAAILCTVADMSEVLVEADVDETDIYAVKLDQKASVRLESVSGEKRWPGTVTKIAATGEKSKTSDIFLFKTQVRIDGAGDLAARLRPGIGGHVEIETVTQASATLVPSQAVVQRALVELPKSVQDEAKAKAGGSRMERAQVVFVVSGGTARAKLVEVGLSDDQFAQITSGVSAGDEVVTGDSRALERLRDGDAVRTR